MADKCSGTEDCSLVELKYDPKTLTVTSVNGIKKSHKELAEEFKKGGVFADIMKALDAKLNPPSYIIKLVRTCPKADPKGDDECACVDDIDPKTKKPIVVTDDPTLVNVSAGPITVGGSVYNATGTVSCVSTIHRKHCKLGYVPAFTSSVMGLDPQALAAYIPASLRPQLIETLRVLESSRVDTRLTEARLARSERGAARPRRRRG